MKNYLFYVAFLCLAAWAGNHQNTPVPPSSSSPVAKSDTGSVTKLQEYSVTIQTKAISKHREVK